MTVSQIMEKMIRSSGGNIHDIEHFMKVWSYAKTIGELEKLDPETQFILEAEAITHDIACPMCREKYGNANGKLQEKESPALISAFFSDTDLTESQVERVSFVVGHHHTYEGVDGLDWQILLEADFIVNASENEYPGENLRKFLETHARTESGKKLIQEVFSL
ncbi:MAG: phosphohydrolase [Clostridia bacterium]|nr:phosphohydrolase [Clostridia bacterium]